jgi:hypothetical protein
MKESFVLLELGEVGLDAVSGRVFESESSKLHQYVRHVTIQLRVNRRRMQ